MILQSFTARIEPCQRPLLWLRRKLGTKKEISATKRSEAANRVLPIMSFTRLAWGLYSKQLALRL